MSTVTDLESYQQFALQQQAQNNAWSAEQAQKQMDFQKQMSDSAHQREVADLKAAGLNPVLSVNSGASVPNGSMAEGDRSAAANVGNILQQVLQAQSAREVAGMYNAATLAAASMAANASMYGADMSYQNAEDHPASMDAVYARLLLGAAGSSSDNKAPGGSAGATGQKLADKVVQTAANLYTGASNWYTGKHLSNAFNSVKSHVVQNKMPFATWMSRNGYDWTRMGKTTLALVKQVYNSIGPNASFLKMISKYKIR